MATLNVFEVTNSELSKALKESVKPAKKATKKTSKKVKESKKVGAKYSKKTIAANKIKLESMQFFKENEDNEEVFDYTPDEEVVLVIDPEMDETPEDVEDAQEEAEELVGDYVCKCSICGANYICDCEEVEALGEDLEEAEAECPVCGEVGEQIIVGEITPAEDAVETEDEVEDEADVDVDVDVDEEEPAEDSDEDNDVDVNINIDVDDLDDEFEEEEEDEDFAESIKRAKRRTLMRRESAKRAKMRKESKAPVAKRPVAKKPMTKRPAVESKLSAKRPLPKKSFAKKPVTESKGFDIDETTLNRMLTKFAKENYSNVRFVKIKNGSFKNNALTLEGVVVTTGNSKRPTKFVCENFKKGNNVIATFKEVGAFTESAIGKNNFTINFVKKANMYTPVALRYSYNVKEGKEAFRVSGKVMNESLKNSKKTK